MLGKMKPSKLYSNHAAEFVPIELGPELNVVFAEIRMPENRDRDTHNLGKTTVGRLLDFCFLAKRNSRFFLFKHVERFKEFVFLLEIELFDGNYITVRRSVVEPSKIAFKKHSVRHQDFSALPDSEWDHVDVPFDRARELLDSLLNWRSLKPWSYRKVLGYLLRSQDDFRDVFQLRKFAGPHADWKPFMAHILGFNADLIVEHYTKEAALKEIEQKVSTIRQELGGEIEDASKIDGLLLLKQQEVDKKQQFLDSFDFRSQDKSDTKQLVEKVDEKIAILNQRRYSLYYNRKKIMNSLEEDQILFNPDEASKLFEEAGILFPEQIKRDYAQLISFNKAITDERRGYLMEERAEIESELRTINAELNSLGKRRSELISFLSSTDFFDKYKRLTSELVTLRADIEGLVRRREFVHRLQQFRANIRKLDEERIHLQADIETDVERKSATSDSLFSRIRLFFNEIVEDVIGKKALLSVFINQGGHLDFRAELLDDAGIATSADRGFSYKKLLCIAFDLAILRAHLDDLFPRFAFHDGVFESLDDRKKENLLGVIRQYNALGIQTIITLIDSDLPPRAVNQSVFDPSEIAILLHDEGDSGRLFKTKPW